MAGDCPGFPQLPPSTGRELGRREYIQEEQASFRPKLERTKWLYWEGGNHPTAPPFLSPTHCVLGGTVGLGIYLRTIHLPVAAVEGPEGGGEG